MLSRLSTTCLPLLALLVAFALLSHDAVMAAGPHDTGVHAGPHDDHDPTSDTACGELIAARTNDAGPDLDVAATPGESVALPTLPASDRIPDTGQAAVDPPAPSQAMLQIWLN